MKKNNGFTMIEVVVALALLAVATTPIVMIFSGALGLLVNSSQVVELNSISRQIKVDVYNAYRDEIELYEYDTESLAQLPLPDEGQEAGPFGILVYDTSTLHPEYKFNIIRIDEDNGDVWDDIFLQGDDLSDLGSIKDRSGQDQNEEIARVFFMNIPIKAVDFWNMDDDGDTQIFTEGAIGLSEIKCMIEVIKVDFD